jgi:hypothetical protein
MTHFEHLKDNKIKVEYLLSKYPETRDSDGALIATFYLNETGGKEILQNKSAHEFLKLLYKDKLTPASTIIRVRRKLQEQIPALRGKNYEKRQKDGDDTRDNIKNL